MSFDSIVTPLILFSVARLDEPPDVEQTRPEKTEFHQSAHIAEVNQERFSGYN